MSTIHNPVNFNPQDYSIVDYFDNRPPQCPFFGGMVNSEAYKSALARFDQERRAWAMERDRLFPKGNCYRCEHCGQGNVRYVVAVDHQPTSDRVCIGHECVVRLGFADHQEFRMAKIRSAAALRNKAEKIAEAQKEFCAKHPELAVVLETINNPLHEHNTFAHDIVGKFLRFGTISDRQLECLIASTKRDLDFAKRKEAQAAAITGTAPSGKCEVTGEIVHTKLQENEFGSVPKMMIRRDDGVRFWVSVPGSLYDEKHQHLDSFKGARVRLTATWEVSSKDASFAFGKRPSKAKLLESDPYEHDSIHGKTANI